MSIAHTMRSMNFIIGLFFLGILVCSLPLSNYMNNVFSQDLQDAPYIKDDNSGSLALPTATMFTSPIGASGFSSMSLQSNTSSANTIISNNTLIDNPRLTLHSLVNTTLAFDTTTLDNMTLRSQLEDAVVDQFTDLVYTIAGRDYNVNVTTELINGFTNKSATITGIHIIKEVLESQVEDIVDSRHNNTVGPRQQELTINSSMLIECTLIRPQFETCHSSIRLTE